MNSKIGTNLPKLSTRAQKALDVLADGGKFVCRLERNSYTGLIAAAPELLEALEKCADWFAGGGDEPDCDNLRALIAKARGEN